MSALDNSGFQIVDVANWGRKVRPKRVHRVRIFLLAEQMLWPELRMTAGNVSPNAVLGGLRVIPPSIVMWTGDRGCHGTASLDHRLHGSCDTWVLTKGRIQKKSMLMLGSRGARLAYVLCIATLELFGSMCVFAHICRKSTISRMYLANPAAVTS
jgi:hypothetical protein